MSQTLAVVTAKHSNYLSPNFSIIANTTGATEDLSTPDLGTYLAIMRAIVDDGAFADTVEVGLYKNLVGGGSQAICSADLYPVAGGGGQQRCTEIGSVTLASGESLFVKGLSQAHNYSATFQVALIG